MAAAVKYQIIKIVDEVGLRKIDLRILEYSSIILRELITFCLGVSV